ncbi:MAG TPA: hypothetical protein ENK01_04550 [Hellea balneolensis]|uniref:Uncharacterized protein n=1 Tax=Hellea balneolensis TaxID=287478 RepID=A0A7V5U1I1_9PROT|nr:hypothetical protein [Hellea balneolensis]
MDWIDCNPLSALPPCRRAWYDGGTHYIFPFDDEATSGNPRRGLFCAPRLDGQWGKCYIRYRFMENETDNDIAAFLLVWQQAQREDPSGYPPDGSFFVSAYRPDQQAVRGNPWQKPPGDGSEMKKRLSGDCQRLSACDESKWL